MLESIFLKLLNISITASWLVFAVILFRVLLKKAPKALHVLMWALVGARLVFPFSIESVWSMIPSTETIPENIMYAQKPAINSGIAVLNSTVNPILESSFTPEPWASANPLQIVIFIISNIWVIGTGFMLLYTIISYWRIRRRVREAIPKENNLWICDQIESPFILGVIKPQIYIPSTLEEADLMYVIAHERAHIKRRDHWWKPLGFLILTVYWFNPILWIAYVLLCRDIELACDEKVIKEMGMESKKPYSIALINCSVSRRSIAACPLAFGEVGVKGRIKSVLNYKKPAFWIILAAIITVGFLAISFLTNPITMKMDERLEVFLNVEVANHFETENSEGKYRCMDIEVLEAEEKGDEIIVYAWVLYQEYGYNGEPYLETSAHIPTVICAQKVDDYYELVEYWEPEDGNRYEESIKEKFPEKLHEKALDSLKYLDKQIAGCEEQANAFYAATLTGKVFRGEEVVYGNRLIDSFIYFKETIPVFVLEKENLHLLTNDFPEPSLSSVYYDIGQIQSFDLTISTFDQLLSDDFEPWADNYSAKMLREENENAYVVNEEGQEYNRFYYLLEQKNGDVYIAYGTIGNGIRYIFKMSESIETIQAGYLTFVCDSAEEWLKPTLILSCTDQTFTFSTSSLSSYLGIGKYTIEDEKLIAKTDDGLYTYVFDIYENYLMLGQEVFSQREY